MGLKEELFDVLGPEFVFSGMNFSENEAKCIVFGVPFDGTACYKPGSRFGPNAIREASIAIGTYTSKEKDFFQNAKTFDIGDLECSHQETGEALAKTEKAVGAILSAKKTPLILGGEHSITFGALKAMHKAKKDFAVLHFDAHPDLLESKKTHHGSFMRHAQKILGSKNILQIGIRGTTREEQEFAKKKGIRQVSAKEALANPGKAEKDIGEFTKGRDVYITFDIDALDTGLVPGTGTPEPGGLDFWSAVDLLGAVKGKVAGLDVVECAPDAERVTQTTAAKLLYEMLAGLDFGK